jgi:ribosomal protein S18 acetylase RimI-like enzyme
MDLLQGLGIATMLIGAGEQRVRAPGLAFAALGVEDNNPRARRLYQRLGYQGAGRQHASWETEDDTGALQVYETTLMIPQALVTVRALTAPRAAVNPNRVILPVSGALGRRRSRR